VTPVVSVIVPLHRMTPAARRCISEVMSLPGGRHELLVVSDRPVDGLPSGAQAVLTGSAEDTSPAEKRDAALAHVQGEICAFLDDDAYPASDWLDCALRRFEDPTIAALGGPGLTPPGSSLRERVGGAFYESPLGSGGLRYRFVREGGVREVDDFPAYNFFVRTEILRGLGGWNSRFYGGEDTKVCLDLVKAGYRIVYDPDVVVYHFRRPIFRSHMRQVGNVGRHRGYFVRAFPQTSARPLYFAPAVALLAAPLVLAWASRSSTRLAGVGAVTVAGGAGIAASALRGGHDGAVAALLPAALAAGHAAYGAGFVRGLLTQRIEAM
jgi:glycosyltransferase involved in cell wall biosynthesis